MPIYEYGCQICGNRLEKLAQMGEGAPQCCGTAMIRAFGGTVAVRDSRSVTGKRNELWIHRMDDIHKAQAERGERLRLVHPKEVVR